MLTAWLVLLQIIPQTSYTADMEMTLNQLFLTKDPEAFDPPEIMTEVYIYDVPDFKEFGLRSVKNYFDLTLPDNENLQVIWPVIDENEGDYLPIECH